MYAPHLAVEAWCPSDHQPSPHELYRRALPFHFDRFPAVYTEYITGRETAAAASGPRPFWRRIQGAYHRDGQGEKAKPVGADIG